jgi:Ca2+-binding RTX toxin-like protein
MHLIRFKNSRAVRPMRLAASVVAVAAAVASVAGIAAARGDAAHSDRATQRHQERAFTLPKVRNGVLAILGTVRDDRIALRLKAGDPGVLQVDLRDDGSADLDFERADFARIAINALGGDDLVRIDESNGVFTDSMATTIFGGPGNDTLLGGSGDETLHGGSGNDSIDGNKGADVGIMGAGDDTFVWDPGDGSDVVEGQAGTDTMLFNGANVSEQVDLSANRNRLKFFRNPGAVTMNTAGVERVDFPALGGADTITVNDLTGTDVRSVNLDLAGTPRGAAGDGQADRIVANATNGIDAIDVSGDAGEVKVSGLAAIVRILHPEVANDQLEVNTLAGTDTVTTAGLAAGAIKLVVDGLLVP